MNRDDRFEEIIGDAYSELKEVEEIVDSLYRIGPDYIDLDLLDNNIGEISLAWSALYQVYKQAKQNKKDGKVYKDDEMDESLDGNTTIESDTIVAKWDPKNNAYLIPKKDWEDWDWLQDGMSVEHKLNLRKVGM